MVHHQHIYDLSPVISETMVVYKNKAEKRPALKMIRTLKQGAYEARVELELHTGSHTDAPYHMLQQGKTIDQMPLDKFFGNSRVLDFTKVKGGIKAKHFANIKIKKNDIVLLKTKNKPEKTFNAEFTYLEKSGARFLASKKVKAVGIDTLGIERNQPNHDTHRLLFKNNTPIFEGLDLSQVKPDRYLFYGFPLKIKKGDASPIRAVLIKK